MKSQALSGCPSVTDSEEKIQRFADEPGGRARNMVWIGASVMTRYDPFGNSASGPGACSKMENGRISAAHILEDAFFKTLVLRIEHCRTRAPFASSSSVAGSDYSEFS